MTLTLPPQLERALNHRAQRRGVTVEQVAIETLEQSVTSEELTEEQKAWIARLERLGSPSGISISEEALSREAIYD